MRERFRLWAVVSVLAVASYASCNEVVVPVDPANIQITPQQETLRVGDVRQFRARVLDASGNELRDRRVSWSSSNTGVVSVDGDGRATALVPGEARVERTSHWDRVTVGALTRTP